MFILSRVTAIYNESKASLIYESKFGRFTIWVRLQTWLSLRGTKCLSNLEEMWNSLLVVLASAASYIIFFTIMVNPVSA